MQMPVRSTATRGCSNEEQGLLLGCPSSCPMLTHSSKCVQLLQLLPSTAPNFKEQNLWDTALVIQIEAIYSS